MFAYFGAATECICSVSHLICDGAAFLWLGSWHRPPLVLPPLLTTCLSPTSQGMSNPIRWNLIQSFPSILWSRVIDPPMIEFSLSSVYVTITSRFNALVLSIIIFFDEWWELKKQLTGMPFAISILNLMKIIARLIRVSLEVYQVNQICRNW